MLRHSVQLRNDMATLVSSLFLPTLIEVAPGTSKFSNEIICGVFFSLYKMCVTWRQVKNDAISSSFSLGLCVSQYNLCNKYAKGVNSCFSFCEVEILQWLFFQLTHQAVTPVLSWPSELLMLLTHVVIVCSVFSSPEAVSTGRMDTFK